MKQALLVTILLAFTSIGIPLVRAQGNVAFANQTTTAISDLNTGQKMAAPAGTFMFGLYVGPVDSPADQLTLVGTGLNPNWPANSGFDGFFQVGNPFVLPSGYPAGTQIAFQVRAWPAGADTSFESAFANAAWVGPGNGIYGESALGFVTPTAPPNGAAQLFGSGPGQVPGFYLPSPEFTPEPSSLALGTAGAVVIWFLRPREKFRTSTNQQP